MAYNGIFRESPISSVCPQGWLRKFLETQISGLTGNIEAAGPPFDDAGWGLPFKRVDYPNNTFTDDWWPYEQTGYWLDGAVRTAFLANHQTLKNRVVSRIEAVLECQASDGYLGPENLRKSEKQNRWAHAVFFRALMAYYSATQDDRIISALTRHYKSNTSSHLDGREVVNTEIMFWLYGITNDRTVLECAGSTYMAYLSKNKNSPMHPEYMRQDDTAREHGVTYNEIAKLAAIYSIYIDDPDMLSAAVNAYEKLQRDQVLVGGVCSSAEFLEGNDPLDSSEVCDIADYTWSLGYLLMATGNPIYADRIEYAVFNAAPGAV
ncbi:MAG: beta-L-arabinofuranosidase domain-containing protein, partial [Spirochaetia bacterium]